MVTRRTFLGTLSLAACSNLALPRGISQRLLHAAGAADGDDVTGHVNIIIGTGGHGHCFPGATVPFPRSGTSGALFTCGLFEGRRARYLWATCETSQASYLRHCGHWRHRCASERSFL